MRNHSVPYSSATNRRQAKENPCDAPGKPVSAVQKPENDGRGQNCTQVTRWKEMDSKSDEIKRRMRKPRNASSSARALADFCVLSGSKLEGYLTTQSQ
jgi:hypothetical protein